MGFEPEPGILKVAVDLLNSDVSYPQKRLRERFDISQMYSRFYMNGAKCIQQSEDLDFESNPYLEGRIETLEKENKKLEKKESIGEALATALRQSAHDLDLPEYTTPELVGPPQRERDREELIAPINDVHLGEEIDPEDIQELGEYDLDIFQRRLRAYQQGLLNHVNAKDTKYKRIHVPFIGDIVDNVSTYSGQRAHVAEQSAYQQVRYAVEAFASHLHWLRKQFPEVVVYGVPGNHGVIKTEGKRGDPSPKDNWDYIFYTEIEERLSEVDGIRFHTSHEWFQVTSILGWEFFLYHGDDLNTYLGMPANTSLNRMQNNIQEMTGRQFDHFVIGHWHPDGSVNLKKLFICGNWPGTNRYSSKRLFRGSLPTQLVMSVHPDWGITWRADIKLEQPGTYQIDDVITYD